MKSKRCLILIVLSVCFCFLSASVKEQKANEEIIAHIEKLLSIIDNRDVELDTEQALHDSREALQLSEKHNYRAGIFKSYHALSHVYFYKGNYKKSIYYACRIENAKGVSTVPGYLVRMNQMKAGVLASLELRDLAIHYYRKALKEADNIKSENYLNLMKTRTYSSMAQLYIQPHERDSMKYYIKKAELYQEKIPIDFVHADNVQLNILKVYNFMYSGDTDSVKAYVDKLIHSVETNIDARRPAVYMLLSDYYLSINKPDSALNSLNEAQMRVSKSGVVHNLPLLYQNKRDVFDLLGQADSSRYYSRMYLDAQNRFIQQKINVNEEVVKLLIREEGKEHRSWARRVALFMSLGIILFFVIAAVVVIELYRRKASKRYKSNVTKLETNLGYSVENVVELARTNDPAFLALFQVVYPRFWKKLQSKHPNLTPTQQHLCAMTYLNFTTREIAEFSHVQVRTIQTGRSRLRKDINLASDVDLYHYLRSIEDSN